MQPLYETPLCTTNKDAIRQTKNDLAMLRSEVAWLKKRMNNMETELAELSYIQPPRRYTRGRGSYKRRALAERRTIRPPVVEVVEEREPQSLQGMDWSDTYDDLMRITSDEEQEILDIVESMEEAAVSQILVEDAEPEQKIDETEEYNSEDSVDAALSNSEEFLVRK